MSKMKSNKRQDEQKPQEIEQQGANDQPNTTIVYLLIEYADERIVSAAIFNNIRRSFEVCSFLDNQHYVNLESFLIQVNPKESDAVFKVLFQMPQLNSERKKILNKLQDLDVNLKETRGYSLHTIAEVIGPKLRFLLKQDPKMYQKEQENKRCLIALDLLIQELCLQKEKTNKNQFNLKFFQNEAFMKLDKACLNALHIFPKTMEKKIISTNSTLYEVLNKCKTSFGTRCLRRWMKQPLQNQDQIQRRLNLIEYFNENQKIKNIFLEELKRLPDLEKIFYVFYRVQSGKKHKCEVSDLIKLYRVIQCICDLVKNLEGEGVEGQLIEEIQKVLINDFNIISKLAGMIEKCIDLNETQSEYMVRPDSQPNLLAIKKSIDDLNKKIMEQKRQAQDFLKSDVDILQSNVYRFVFECVKKNLVQKVKEDDHYKFISAKQTKMTFTTETLIKHCNSIMTFQNQYREQQQEILNKMFKIVAGYYPVMERLSGTLAELDVLIGWTGIVSTSVERWTKPEFSDYLMGLQMRHPCVKNCVPNDININKNKTIILTGPNMGGKSTYIRTIGVCCYLAHLGMYVPATNFICPIIDAIICRVGASDQQIKGISTFMGEMIDTSCMLKTATNKSLVLIDQLGRGTSTNEGFGLSWSLCKYLHTKINPFCLFATHYHEMIKIEEEVEGICNMYTSCKMSDDNKLIFEYRVFKGKVQKSYGIQVARMLSFPKEIIEDAESYLQVYQNKNYTKKYSLTEEQQNHISDLVDQMNQELEKHHDRVTQDKIKNKYYTLIQDYTRVN